MKPISIAFQCFGPYLERQFIDFTVMGRDGIFLICGDTGAGKTTVLDAISCALYGVATDGRRGKTAALRSEFAPEDRKTEVEFIFEHNGIKYRFYRSLLPKKKLEDQKKQEGFAEATQVKENGALTDRFHVVFECERQVGEGNWVSIWEGAKKGMSSNAAKEVIGLNHKQFSQIVILPQGKFETFIMSPSGQKEEILKSLFHTQRWEDAVDKIEREAQEEERSLDNDRAFIRGYLVHHKCETVEEFVEKATIAEAQEADIKRKMKTADARVRKAKQKWQLALQMLPEFKELERTERELEDLLSMREEKQEEERLLEKAKQAELLRQEYSVYRKGEEEYKQIEGEYVEADQYLTEIEDTIRKADEDLREQRKEIREKCSALASVRSKNGQNIEKLLEEFAKSCDQLADARETREKNRLEKKPTWGSLERDAKEQVELLRATINELCGDLVGEYISEELVAVENRTMNSVVKQVNAQEVKKQKGMKDRAYEKWKKIRRRWVSIRKEKGFESDEEYLASCLPIEEITARIETVTEYKNSLRKAQEEFDRRKQKLHGIEKPDIDELTGRAQRNREQHDALQIAYREIQRVRVEEEILRQIKELHDKNREREKTLERRKGFIKMLKGSHGVGIQRYILGVMLSTVIREANHILQTVLEGRYTIHRTDEGAGKKGLELAVCSYGEGEGRLVKTLSGGEKFLISLCLAIGLSSVVQAQGGGRVEALFVDEGFGTLDRERLDDAVNILQMSRRETDVIGIISHVEALREIIPAKIRIQKAKTGSTLLIEA